MFGYYINTIFIILFAFVSSAGQFLQGACWTIAQSIDFESIMLVLRFFYVLYVFRLNK